MQHQADEKLLVVMLDDMIDHAIPRLLCIRKHLRNGEVLADADIHFLTGVLDHLSLCYSGYHNDPQCRVIFASIAHLLFKVIKRGLKNEKRMNKHLLKLKDRQFEFSATPI